MDPQYADKTWKILRDAIHEITNRNASGLSFEELYRNAYNMVLHKFGDRLYNGVVEEITAHLKGVSAKVEKAQGQEFLRELNARWANYCESMRWINDILMYMDRTYVVQQGKTVVHELGLELWRDVVVRAPNTHSWLQQTMLDNIRRERQGEVIDRGLMKSIVQMLMDLGLCVYQEDFERPFLDDATMFYISEATAYMSECDCPEYLRKAQRRLEEELERCSSYLDKSTEVKIAGVVEHEMLEKHMQTLVDMENSGLVSMLLADKYEDLARMYRLFKRTAGGLATMRKVMLEHLRSSGKVLVNDPELCKSPVAFVERLLAKKAKYDTLITRAFDNEKSFATTLNSAFEHFINLNARSPEYISLYVDDKLRKGLKGVSEEDAEKVLDRVMMLFRFLQEKDVFEKYYKSHLARRLLSGRTVSDDAERSLIIKLKYECGYQFTSKLESMFTDMRTSRDTLDGFRNMMRSNGTSLLVDLNVQVLTTGSWPTSGEAKCNLPQQLVECCEHFSKFYLSTYTGRRLTWQTNMGTADVRAQFANKWHDLNVTTYQLCILLLFNDADRLSYEQIAAATEIPASDLKRSLQSLACVKGKNVLRKEPQSKEINQSDVFSFNEKFTSKLVKIKIGMVSAQKESDAEKQETRTKVDEDRKPQIEAAIVRLLKSRRVMDHNTVIAEVTKQLQSRFVPNPTIIKKRVESLIEREFLERDKDDRRKYRYLA
jgi:cullin 3